MKLLEFKISDKHNIAEIKIKSLASESAAEEAELRGWAPGYEVRQVSGPKKTADDELIYQFEVVGSLLSDGDGEGKVSASKSPRKSDIAAAPAERG